MQDEPELQVTPMTPGGLTRRPPFNPFNTSGSGANTFSGQTAATAGGSVAPGQAMSQRTAEAQAEFENQAQASKAENSMPIGKILGFGIMGLFAYVLINRK